MLNLAVAYRKAGRADHAVPLVQKGAGGSPEIAGRRSFRYLVAVNNLAVAYQERRTNRTRRSVSSSDRSGSGRKWRKPHDPGLLSWMVIWPSDYKTSEPGMDQ